MQLNYIQMFVGFFLEVFVIALRIVWWRAMLGSVEKQ